MNTCQDTKEKWIEENRDALEKRYYEMYELSAKDAMDGCLEAFKMFEDALVRMGILEEDEVIESPEDMSEAESWDEWALDNQIDTMRDQMAYER